MGGKGQYICYDRPIYWTLYEIIFRSLVALYSIFRNFEIGKSIPQKENLKYFEKGVDRQEQPCYNTQAIKSYSDCKEYRGVEQLEARRAHNPEVVGSSPASATINRLILREIKRFLFVFGQQSCSKKSGSKVDPDSAPYGKPPEIGGMICPENKSRRVSLLQEHPPVFV